MSRIGRRMQSGSFRHKLSLAVARGLRGNAVTVPKKEVRSFSGIKLVEIWKRLPSLTVEARLHRRPWSIRVGLHLYRWLDHICRVNLMGFPSFNLQWMTWSLSLLMLISFVHLIINLHWFHDRERGMDTELIANSNLMCGQNGSTTCKFRKTFFGFQFGREPSVLPPRPLNGYTHTASIST